MDPHAPARLYAGGLRLWRTTNGGDFAEPNTGPMWSDLNLPEGTASNFISAIAVSPRNPDIVWAARNSGAVFRTSNAMAPLPTWTRLGVGSLPARYVTNLTIWPHDDAVVYATFGGSSPGNQNIWRTLDGGASWHSTAGSGSGALPAVPVREVLAHPTPQGGHWLYDRHRCRALHQRRRRQLLGGTERRPDQRQRLRHVLDGADLASGDARPIDSGAPPCPRRRQRRVPSSSRQSSRPPLHPASRVRST